MIIVYTGHQEDFSIFILKFKTKITLLISIIVLLGFFGSGYIFNRYSMKVKEEAISRIQNQLSEKILTRLGTIIEVPERINNLNSSFVKIEGLSGRSLNKLRMFFVEELKRNPQIDIIALGLENGSYIEAQQLENGIIRVGERSDSSGGSLNIWEIDSNLHKTRLVKHIENYDHRKRPWYLRKQGWSDVYFFSSNHHPAISVNKMLSDKTGNFLGVFVTSVSLDNISIFLKKINISRNSRIIITDPKGLILGTSFPQPLIDLKGKRIYGDKTDIPIVNKAVRISKQNSAESFSIQEDGRTTAVKQVTFVLPSGINWNILILTPEKDFTEKYDKFTHKSILFLLMIFIISFITAQILSKKLTRPITYLAKRISRIAYDESMQNKPIIPPEIRDSSSEIKILSSNLEIMITRLNSAFSTIEKSRREYKNLVENINTIIMKVAPDGTITYCNPYGLNFYGYTKEEFIGNTVQKTVLRGDDEKPIEILRKIFTQNGRYWNGENRNVTKDGRSVWILWSNRLIFDKNGKVVELLSTGQDITERKNAEKKLENYFKKNSILLGEIHHRVKNNLQIIISLINLQLDKSEGPSIENALQGIKARIQSMAIVHEMLYSSTSFSEIDLYMYIQSLAYDISQTFRDEEKKINISVFSKPVFLELEQAITVGLILNELLSNSIKYAFEGRSSGEIEITIKEFADRRISITVKDNGIGFKDSGGIREGLGTVLIDALTQQLNAEIKRETSNGFSFQFTFKATGNGHKS